MFSWRGQGHTLGIFPQGVLVFHIFFIAELLKSHSVCRQLKITKPHTSTVLLLVDDRVHEILSVTVGLKGYRVWRRTRHTVYCWANSMRLWLLATNLAFNSARWLSADGIAFRPLRVFRLETTSLSIPMPKWWRTMKPSRVDALTLRFSSAWTACFFFLISPWNAPLRRQQWQLLQHTYLPLSQSRSLSLDVWKIALDFGFPLFAQSHLLFSFLNRFLNTAFDLWIDYGCKVSQIQGKPDWKSHC